MAIQNEIHSSHGTGIVTSRPIDLKACGQIGYHSLAHNDHAQWQITATENFKFNDKSRCGYLSNWSDLL
jgi:hypothetical protein